MSKTYYLYSTLTLSPSKHWGVLRAQCKCGLCANGPITKTSVEYYDHGEGYNVGEESFIMNDLETASNYFMAKYEDEDWDSYEYIYESDYLREEKLINPNDNDEEEFSDGIGDEQMKVTKVELYDDETNKLLETNQVKN